jgi:hypothetical protein
MSDDMRAKLLATPEEIKRLTAEVRLGQLVVNLAYLARCPSAEVPWEDEELLTAAEQHLKNLSKWREIA